MTTPQPAQRLDTACPAAPFITEEQLMASIIAIAKALKYRVYHTFDSRRSTAGYPDICCVRNGPEPGDTRLIYIETKSSRGRVTPEQREWLHALSQVQGVEVYVFRPEDLDDVFKILE